MTKKIKSAEIGTPAASTDRAANGSPPEFYRLPAKGGDPHFGFSRTFYYQGENRGYWKLVRIREKGKLRGVTLIPFDAVAAFVRKQISSSEKRWKPSPRKKAEVNEGAAAG